MHRKRITTTAVWSPRISSEGTFRRYNQKWPTRRYWLVGDIRVLNDPQADPLEVQYRIRYAVKNQQQERTGTAIKTVKLQKTPAGFEITSVRERTLN